MKFQKVLQKKFSERNWKNFIGKILLTNHDQNRITLINDINNSNCYLVQDQEKSKCIIIDPGSRNTDNVSWNSCKKKIFN